MQTKAHSEVTGSYHQSVGDYRTGKRNTKSLITGREGAPANYKLTFGGDGSASDWTTPRHRHTFNQIRYPISGDYVMKSDEVLPAGWVAYFPESVYYGPQVKSKNLCMLTLQFGGPSGLGFWSQRQRKEAYDALLTKGKFENGVYTWTDEQGRVHNKDAAEATEELAFKRKTVYPEPRYSDIVTMNPASYNWIKDKDAAGVARKNLGVFTERDIRIGFVRLEKGASVQLGTQPSPEILFLKEGAVTHDNNSYGQHTAFSTEVEEAPVSLTAIEPSEFVYMKLPTF